MGTIAFSSSIHSAIATRWKTKAFFVLTHHAPELLNALCLPFYTLPRIMEVGKGASLGGTRFWCG